MKKLVSLMRQEVKKPAEKMSINLIITDGHPESDVLLSPPWAALQCCSL